MNKNQVRRAVKIYVKCKKVVRFESYYMIVLKDKIVFVANDVEFDQVVKEIHDNECHKRIGFTKSLLNVSSGRL